MFEDRLGELERRFRQSGDPQDEARWLLERVRSGALGEDRLALAGWVGHAAAPEPEGGLEPDLVRFVDGLARWGKEALVRAATAAARAAAPLWPEDDYAMRRCVEAAEAWVLRQSEMHGRLCRDAADHLAQWTRRQDWWGRMHTDAARAAQEAAESAAWSPQQLTQMIEKWEVDPNDAGRDRFTWSKKVSLEAARGAASHAASALSRAGGNHLLAAAEDKVRTAIRDALAPWALGYADPLAPRPEPFDPSRPIRPPEPPRPGGGSGWPL